MNCNTTHYRANSSSVPGDPSGYAFSYGYPNANAVAIHKRTGYKVLGKMGRFVRVLRHASYIEKRYGWARRSQLAGAIIDRAALAVSVARAIPTRRRYELRWEPDFDERWDQLWERHLESAGSTAITCRRSSVFLRWRCLRKPNETNAIAALVERGTNAVAAYAVVRGGPTRPAELIDLFGASTEAVDTLLGQLVPALYLRGHSSVEVHYLGHPRIPEVLARHWFSQREAERMVVVSPGEACPIEPAVLCDPNAWYMTDVDEDT